ncbi:MAG: hypothetical protein HY048_02650 [Acidobacteria bacterium]|nr:hypothetical protein [Acidobacteriota bacterium]
MRRTRFTLALAVLTAFTLGALQPTSAGAAGADDKVQHASGTVTSVSLTSITIGGGAGGGAKFSRTFAVDADTKVIAKGAGTTSAAMGGRAAITDMVTTGDKVNVSYHKMGEMNHASEVRVTTKAAK